jgi:hypothetical protein
MGKSLRSSAAALGSKGGRSGVGASKKRGDSDFYRRLVALRRDRKDPDTGMQHRHLNHRDFTLAAIDDIIGNGGWTAWKRLRRAVLTGEVREKVLKVCASRMNDPSAQRYSFWNFYAKKTAASA